jgi:hypothetical protein
VPPARDSGRDASWSPVQDRRDARTHADSLRAVGPPPASVHRWARAPRGPATRLVWVCDREMGWRCVRDRDERIQRQDMAG